MCECKTRPHDVLALRIDHGQQIAVGTAVYGGENMLRREIKKKLSKACNKSCDP